MIILIYFSHLPPYPPKSTSRFKIGINHYVRMHDTLKKSLHYSEDAPLERDNMLLEKLRLKLSHD